MPRPHFSSSSRASIAARDIRATLIAPALLSQYAWARAIGPAFFATVIFATQGKIKLSRGCRASLPVRCASTGGAFEGAGLRIAVPAPELIECLRYR
jgi:hypothetical protein